MSQTGQHKRRIGEDALERVRARLAHVDDGWFFSQIADRVAERRKELGLSQAELAELVATTQSAIARLESGGRPPRIDTLLRIAEALDCDLQVELRFVPDWAQTIARHWLYESADAIRIQALMQSDDSQIAGLSEKIDREEAYHRMHADMWADRLREEARFQQAVDELWPYALGVLEPDQRDRLCKVVGREPVDLLERGTHTDELAPLWEEMTMVRRSVPGASW